MSYRDKIEEAERFLQAAQKAIQQAKQEASGNITSYDELAESQSLDLLADHLKQNEEIPKLER